MKVMDVNLPSRCIQWRRDPHFFCAAVILQEERGKGCLCDMKHLQ